MELEIWDGAELKEMAFFTGNECPGMRMLSYLPSWVEDDKGSLETMLGHGMGEVGRSDCALEGPAWVRPSAAGGLYWYNDS